MRVEIKNVTPGLAASFLEENTSNRKINKKQLDMLVRSMLAGEWRLTHQGIALYEDGSIADGQHRLNAIIQSGVPCRMPIFYGIEKEKTTTMAIDCGRGRTVLDGMAISGDSVSVSDVTIARGIEFGYVSGAMKKLTHSETAGIISKHRESLNIARDILSTNKTGVSISPVKVAILNAIKSGVDINLADEFYKVLLSGEYCNSIMINAVRLKNKLMTANYNGGSDRLTAYNMAYNTIISTSEGKDVKRINSK
jgi:hypothetical protein